MNLEHVKDRDARKRAWCEQNGFTLIAIGEEGYKQDPPHTTCGRIVAIGRTHRASGVLDAIP